MKNYIFLILFFIPCIGFSSPYDYLTTINEKNGDVFIDYSSLQKRKNLVKVWIYVDYQVKQSFQNENYLSIRNLVEIHCDDRTYRMLETTYFEKNHLQGKIVYLTVSPTEFLNIPPNSFSSLLRSSTCFLKK